MAEKLSHGHDSAYGHNHPGNYVLQLAVRTIESNLRIGPYHLVDNVLDQPAMCVNLERTSFERHITCYGIESRVCASPDAT